MELTTAQLLVLLYAGVIYGLAKTGITGLTALLVPLLLAVFTPGQALGIALPILVFTDILTVIIMRKSVMWKNVFLAVPCALVGVFTGWRILAYAKDLPDASGDVLLRRLIACILIFIVISGIALRLLKRRAASSVTATGGEEVSARMPAKRFIFASAVAFVGGVVTMLANNSGPAWVVYLMLFRLDKFNFLGTVAWLIFILNVVKLPLAANLGYVTLDTLQVNVYMVPMVLVGLYFGRKLLVRIPQRVFDNAVQVLALGGALYLLIFS